MIDAGWLLLASSVLVAAPAVRAALRVLVARRKHALAARKDAARAGLTAQRAQTEKVEAERLRNDAHDLVEFGALLPTWAIVCGLAGILLGLLGRAQPMLWP